MFNVQQITSRLSEMSDAQLAQYARMHKDDPYILPLAASESKRRQQLRQGMQARQVPQATVADQDIAQMEQQALPEDTGISNLAEQSLVKMADGGIAGYAEGKSVFDPDAALQNPNVQKFLTYINTYEGNPQANEGVGYRKFHSFEDHPRKAVKFNKKGDKSTAAGLFQIIGDTWDAQKKKLGLEDFSPINQKRAAVGILKDLNALKDIEQGNFEAAKRKAAKVWASIPGSTIGESTGQHARVKPHAEAILGNTPRQKPATRTAEVPAKPATKTAAAKTREPSLTEQLTSAIPIASATAAEVVPRGAFNPPADMRGIAAVPQMSYAPVAAPQMSVAPAASMPPQDTRPFVASPQSSSGVVGRVAEPKYPATGIYVPPSQGIATLPATPAKPAPVKPAPAKKAAPVADDTTYDIMTGLPITGSAVGAGPGTESPVAAQLAGIADIPLGIPGAVYGTLKTDFYNLPFGKHYTWEEAQKAGNDNWLQYLRLGKSLGLEKDPAYRKDPFNYLLQLPSMGVEKIAEGTGTNKAAAQLILDNALLALPFLKNVKPVETGMPKLPGKETPTVGAAEAAAAAKQAAAEAEAAKAKVEAPRLPAPQTETPGVVRVTPEGQGVMPSGTAAGSRKAGLAGLAEDQLALRAAIERARAAEDLAARAAKAEKPTVMERLLNSRAATTAPLAALSSTTGAVTPAIPPTTATAPEIDYMAPYKYGDTYGPATPVEEAKQTAEDIDKEKAVTKEETKPGFGLSNEDILTMGLNMMMAPAGQPGGEFSQLASNLGRSGIATLQAKREREKLAAEQAYKDLYGQYLQAQTNQFGREPEDIRSLRLLQKDPKLMQTLARKQMYGDITGAQTRLIGEFNKARVLNPMLTWEEFIKGVPEEYLPGGGMGFGLPQGVTVTPRK